jgi:hypothetical protein
MAALSSHTSINNTTQSLQADQADPTQDNDFNASKSSFSVVASVAKRSFQWVKDRATSIQNKSKTVKNKKKNAEKAKQRQQGRQLVQAVKQVIVRLRCRASHAPSPLISRGVSSSLRVSAAFLFTSSSYPLPCIACRGYLPLYFISLPLTLSVLFIFSSASHSCAMINFLPASVDLIHCWWAAHTLNLFAHMLPAYARISKVFNTTADWFGNAASWIRVSRTSVRESIVDAAKGAVEMIPAPEDAASAAGVPSGWIEKGGWGSSSSGDDGRVWLNMSREEATVAAAGLTGVAVLIWLIRRRKRSGGLGGGDGGDGSHVSAEWVNTLMQGYAPDIFNGRYEEVSPS